jgi:hypothetical protein
MLPRFEKDPGRGLGIGVDANRVMDMYDNAIYIIRDVLGTEVDFEGSTDRARDTLLSIVERGVAPPEVTLPLKNNFVDGLVLHVDVRKRKFSITMAKHVSKRVAINSALRAITRG